jgi:alpha-L-fucosidase-like protein
MNLLLLAVSLLASLNAQTYEPTWDSVDERPILAWFSNAKFGIFHFPAFRKAQRKLLSSFSGTAVDLGVWAELAIVGQMGFAGQRQSGRSPIGTSLDSSTHAARQFSTIPLHNPTGTLLGGHLVNRRSSSWSREICSA